MSIKLVRIQLRLPFQVKHLVRQAAAISGQSLSAFIRAVLAERARQVVKRQSTTVLTRRDWKRFLTIITKETEPVASLRSAVKRLDLNPEVGKS